MARLTPSRRLVLGVDGGGTKTRVALADMDGNVVSTALSGPANFQGIGHELAGQQLAAGIKAAMEKIGAAPADVACAAYGIAGADREKDFDTVAGYVETANPASVFVLCNDTTLALRAGTSDGVGVASVAGTGSNTMGFNEAGDHVKVGGYGGLSGDYGSSFDLSGKAIVAAWKEWDGRGPRTALTPLICKALRVQEIADILEFTYFDSYSGDVNFNEHVPLLFQAADMGDKTALRILRSTGRQIAGDVLSCMKRLFPDHARPVTLVLGGSIYQKGSNPAMIDSLAACVRRVYPKLRLVRLTDEPCLGALFLAFDEQLGRPAPAAMRDRLRKTFLEKLREEG